jgi:hypothetical protein
MRLINPLRKQQLRYQNHHPTAADKPASRHPANLALNGDFPASKWYFCVKTSGQTIYIRVSPHEKLFTGAIF